MKYNTANRQKIQEDLFFGVRDYGYDLTKEQIEEMAEDVIEAIESADILSDEHWFDLCERVGELSRDLVVLDSTHLEF